MSATTNPSSGLARDSDVDAFRRDGYVIIEGVITGDLLEGAREALGRHFPSPTAYHEDPSAHEDLSTSQFAGLERFPWRDLALNRLVVEPRLVDSVRRLLGVDDIRLGKGELWAKYGGAVDYDQEHHRDYGNHTLSVPRRDGLYREATTFLFLSDVTEDCGPTAIVPRPFSDTVPYGIARAESESFRDVEVLATGPAGALLVYAYDVFHRGTAMRNPRGHRFTLLTDYRDARAPWIGKHAFGAEGLNPSMSELLSKIAPTQRALLDFPLPGHPYWNAQTVADCALRYPKMDMTPYADGLAAPDS